MITSQTQNVGEVLWERAKSQSVLLAILVPNLFTFSQIAIKCRAETPFFPRLCGNEITMSTTKVPARPASTVPLIGRIVRTPFMKALLWPTEKMTAGRTMASDGTEIVQTKRLTPELLRDLFTNRILAIQLPGFANPEVCEVMSSNILKQKLKNWNIYDLKTEYKPSDVEVFGEPFSMANKTDESWQRYFDNSIATSENLRGMAAPYVSPYDKFRIMLDELWDHGMTVARYKGRKMTPGLVRVMFDTAKTVTETSLGCHVDTSPLLSNSFGQFSVNVYLKQAQTGGHLYLWNPKITTLPQAIGHWHSVKNFFVESNYNNEELQLRFQKLLPRPLKIEIKSGDAVIFNTGRPHAVVPFTGGPRVSLQAFLNYKKGRPVEIWA